MKRVCHAYERLSAICLHQATCTSSEEHCTYSCCHIVPSIVHSSTIRWWHHMHMLLATKLRE
jgi:hypothetical protein